MLHVTPPQIPTGTLRIIHCVRSPIGGIFRNVLDLAAEQSRRGHLVGIVLDSTSGGAFEATKIALAAPHLALGVTRLPMSRTVRPSDIIAAWRVYKSVRDLAPDVLHGHGAKGGTFARVVGTVLSTARRPVARIYTPHGGSLHFPNDTVAGRVYFSVERFLEHLCDGIIHVSRYEAEAYLDKVGKPRCGATVIVNGLRAEEFADIRPMPDARDLVYMGMMRELKGPDVLIKAVALLRDATGRAPTVHMLGDGPDRDAFVELAASLGLGEEIAFHDPKPTRDGMAMGRLMIVPSRAESMPYIVLETVAAGMPILATRVGGVAEILSGQIDRLLPPGDVSALAEAIGETLSDFPAALLRAKAARRVLRQRFTVEAMTDAVERLYVAALTRRRERAGSDVRPNLQLAE
jgi:glycosyltransferase involved in cell wall biosynthesis